MEIRDIGPGQGSRVVVGRVGKVHGIKGEIKIYPSSGNAHDLLPFSRLYFSRAQGEPLVFDVRQCRVQGEFAVVGLTGLVARAAAENLRDYEVLVDKESLPALGSQSYYWHDIEGLTAVTGEGRVLGRVSSLFPTRAHPVLVIRDEEREYLIPVHEQFIASVDVAQGTLVVTPPAGLLEMNE